MLQCTLRFKQACNLSPVKLAVSLTALYDMCRVALPFC